MSLQQEFTQNDSRSLGKIPFDIDRMLKLIEKAIEVYPKAMLFELYDKGYQQAFQILIACMISIRTLDEVSLKVSLRLFKKAKTPKGISQLSIEELDEILKPSTYHRQKAERILHIANEVERKYRGKLPCDVETLLNLPGVGPKTAHLVMGITCNESFIGVDTHVHRITNRWGYIHSKNPNQTEEQLRQKLPKKHWVQINALLVPFGKHICTWRKPHCLTCPVLKYCRQVGVTEYR